MRLKSTIIGMTAAAVMTVAVPALAEPIEYTNTRPVAGVSAASLATLQAELDVLAGAGVIDAVADQNAAGYWMHPGGGFGAIAPQIQVRAGAFFAQGLVSFGIWSGTDSTNIVSAEVFGGGTAEGSLATIQWAAGDPNSVSINGGASIAGINRSGFGFYITSPEGGPDGRHYSTDSLNDNSSIGGADNVAQMLAYFNNVGGIWYLAFEDLNCGFGCDNYSDLVVSIESMVPVPEPGSMLLLGTGLLGLAAAARRRMRKA